VAVNAMQNTQEVFKHKMAFYCPINAFSKKKSAVCQMNFLSELLASKKFPNE